VLYNRLVHFIKRSEGNDNIFIIQDVFNI
jgi:hypothetical protein